MTIIKNQRGIALVLVMILALIGLAIVSALIYMATMGTRLSGSQRFYRTTEEAGLGGVETAAEFIRSRSWLTMTPPPIPGALIGTAAGTSTGNCFTQKMTSPRDPSGTNPGWAACSADDKTLDATSNPDMTFVLGNYKIFAKIVDTVDGNSDTGGLVTVGDLGGAGTVNSNSGLVNPPHQPYLYRMEIQAQDKNVIPPNNPKERSRLSALYAY